VVYRSCFPFTATTGGQAARRPVDIDATLRAGGVFMVAAFAFDVSLVFALALRHEVVVQERYKGVLERPDKASEQRWVLALEHGFQLS